MQLQMYCVKINLVDSIVNEGLQKTIFVYISMNNEAFLL